MKKKASKSHFEQKKIRNKLKKKKEQQPSII